MATLSINEYRRKRDFRRSPEPAGAAPAGANIEGQVKAMSRQGTGVITMLSACKTLNLRPR